jgi:hypothetical protein
MNRQTDRQTDRLKDTLKLIFETSLSPKYNIYKSKILKEEITLDIKMQFHKKFQLFLTYHIDCYICHVLSLFVAMATNFFKIGRKEKDKHNLQTALLLDPVYV